MKENDEIDAVLREMLEPDTETVNRVIRSAIQTSGRSRNRNKVISGIALVALVVLVCSIFLVRYLSRPSRTVDYITIETIGDVTLLRSTSGEIWVFGTESKGNLPISPSSGDKK
jgi:hypothetical protein